MSFEEMLERYLAAVRRTDSVSEAIRRWWPHFAGFCRARGIDSPGGVAATDVGDFQQGLAWEFSTKGRFYSANTIDQMLRCTRDVLRWAAATGLVERDPTQALVLPRPVQPAAMVWSWDEVQAILSAHDRAQPKGVRDAALLAIIAEAGLEVREVIELREGDEDKLELEPPTRALLRVYCEEFRPKLLRPETPSRWLFLNRSGARLGPQSVTNALSDAQKLAGLPPGGSLLCLRRSYRAGKERADQAHRHFSLIDLTERPQSGMLER